MKKKHLISILIITSLIVASYIWVLPHFFHKEKSPPQEETNIAFLWSYDTSESLLPPTIGDIDCDGKLEIVTASYNGTIYVWYSNGSYVDGWPIYLFNHTHHSSMLSPPSLGDLDGDGDLEIAAYCNGTLYVWYNNGTLVPGWPKIMPTGPYDYGMIVYFSSPIICDLDGDGYREVVTINRDGPSDIHVFHGNGIYVNGWEQGVGGSVCCLAIGDIDNDSSLEIVGGTVEGTDEGKVYVWYHNGTIMNNWPQDVNGTLCSVVLGDVNNDDSLEVIASTSHGTIYIFNANGTVINGWPLNTYALTNCPILVDLDGNGDLEIIAKMSVSQTIERPPGQCMTSAWHHDGSNVTGGLQNIETGNWPYQPIVGDIDGDGVIEIITTQRDGADYHLSAWKLNGSQINGWPKITVGYASVALGDLNNDGRIEIIATTSNGIVYVWSGGNYLPEKVLWPMAFYDSQHTNCVPIL